MMKSGTRELGIAERFAAGSMAGVFSQTAIYPLEVCWRTHFHLAVWEDQSVSQSVSQYTFNTTVTIVRGYKKCKNTSAKKYSS